jgi:hypothetical protein
MVGRMESRLTNLPESDEIVSKLPSYDMLCYLRRVFYGQVQDRWTDHRASTGRLIYSITCTHV